MSQALHIKGARIRDGDVAVERDLYVQNGRIVHTKPNHALEVDLEGYTLFPGLINAHDHLELNHFPRTKFREVYDNAHQWGSDVNARLDDEPFKTLRSYPLWDKVFIGGLKNLLCGATTVVHHGAPHKPMYRKDFPVRVLKNYGWAHSLHFNTKEEIVRSYQNTPKEHPWFIHLAEGTDEVAVGEYQRLKKLGCVGENTVIVHGVGMTEEDIADAAKTVCGLVWCPSTNYYLLGQTTHAAKWIEYGANLALGSDSRLTADDDYLGELRALGKLVNNDVLINFPQKVNDNRGMVMETFQQLGVVTANKVLRLREFWYPNTGDFADFIAWKPNDNRFHRHGLPIIIFDGIPQIGDADMMAKFPFVQTVACVLDGVEKRMNVELARQVHRCRLKEQGLEVDALPQGKRFIFF